MDGYIIVTLELQSSDTNSDTSGYQSGPGAADCYGEKYFFEELLDYS